MNDIRLLIADSDFNIRGKIKEYVISEGFSIDEAEDGISALKLFKGNDYKLVILDNAVSELDGYDVCSQIRKVSEVPIIITSHDGREDLKLSFFSIGADDYVLKPFSVLEIIARIKVFLRRSNGIKSPIPRILTLNEIQVDTFSRTVYIDEKIIQMTPKEYELLLYLFKNPNKALSREILLDDVWGYDFVGSDRTIDTHIKTLRENLKPYHRCIVTIWGYGYKLEVKGE